MSKDNKAKKTKKRYRSLEKKTALWGLIFLLPWLIGLVFFFLRPLVLTFYYAFSSMEMVYSRVPLKELKTSSMLSVSMLISQRIWHPRLRVC